MIQKLYLQNYKCFHDLTLDFSNINILTGLNGMGKSSVIQSLLLMAQSKNTLLNNGLSINGKYINLGIGQDILFEDAEEDEICISYCTEKGMQECYFEYDSNSDILPLNQDKSHFDILTAIERIVYLSAYRIEPQQFYHIGNESDVENHFFSNKGEYAIQYLDAHADDSIANNNIVPYAENTISLQKAVSYWLGMISPGVSPKININKTSKIAELKYDFVEGKNRTRPYKSINVGFGITYVLPVIVALISASPNDILLIENPEAHIHPKGQRMLGELISRIGATGVQIILETHSDHVLNGIRVSAKKNVISPEKCRIYFFYKDNQDGYRHKVVEPKLESDGRLTEWPEGFFDEWDNALMELL